MKNITTTIIITSLIILSILLISCSNQTGNAVKDSPFKEEYKIGIIGEFSGPTASYGDAMKAGYELALEDIKKDPKLSKVNFKIIYGDSKCNPKEAQTESERLLGFEDVDIALGPYCSGTNLITAQTSKKYDKITISPVGTSSQLPNLGVNYFRLQPGKIEIERLVKYIQDKTPDRAFAIIFVNNDFGVDYKNMFEKEISKFDGTVVLSEGFELISTDYKTIISKIISKKPDAIFFIGSEFHIGFFLKQLDELGSEIQVYSTINTQYQSVKHDSSEGVIYAFNNDIDINKKQKEFKDRLIATGTLQPSFTEANSYDVLMLAVTALKKCGSDSKCQRDYLNDLENYEGVSGIFDFRSGDIKKEMIIKQYKDGEFVKIE